MKIVQDKNEETRAKWHARKIKHTFIKNGMPRYFCLVQINIFVVKKSKSRRNKSKVNQMKVKEALTKH